MKVLITGINGFIGKNIAGKFRDCDYEVVGIDLKAEGNVFKTYTADLIKDDLVNILKKERPHMFIHCAGLASVPYSIENPEEDFIANTAVVHRILFAMHQSGLSDRRFILLSSAAVYGQPTQLPISETNECSPLSPYALHKKTAEDICVYFIKNYGFDIKIARIFSAYGPGLRKQIFWDMFQKIKSSGKLTLFGTGNESRDYIYIDDLIEAIYLIAVDNKRDHIFWNVANGQEIFIKDVVRLFAQKEGIPEDRVTFNGIIREGDPLNWCADISRIQQIGYKSRVSIEEGIEKYIKWVERI